MNVDFEFGEKKHIKLRICSCKGTDFLIEELPMSCFTKEHKKLKIVGEQ